jgi:hypothetical protein
MIKFFRHIRKNLLMKNKTGTYLKYAFGEIFLVVLGILIALQINTWNEERKAITSEKSQINNIYEDIQRDVNKIDWIIGQLTNQYTTGVEILEILENKESFTIDSARMVTNIAWVMSDLIPVARDENTWDDIKVQGIKTYVINDSLTGQLNTFYAGFDRNIDRFEQSPKKFRQELRELTANCHNSNSVKAIFKNGVGYYGQSSSQLRYCVLSLEETPQLVGAITMSSIVNIELYKALKKEGETIMRYMEQYVDFSL